MSAPIVFFTGCCFGKIPMNDQKDIDAGRSERALGNKLVYIAPTFDAILSITCLIIGILGAIQTVVMPAAAAYALIGISCGVTILWIALAIFLAYNEYNNPSAS